MPMLTDAECIQRCLAGDRQAFGVLVERYRAAIALDCGRRIGDADEAESLAQEVFLHAFYALHALREVDKFPVWLRAIARHQCLSWHRRYAGQRHEVLDENLLRAPDAFTSHEEQLQVRQAMQSLPAPQRQVLVGKYLLGCSLEELARQHGVPAETIRSRLRRAKNRFKEVYTSMTANDNAPGNQPSDFTRRVLERIELVQQESGLVWPLYACLKASGSAWSLPYVSGMMGTAFEMTVDERISYCGPTHVMDWKWWFSILPELGYQVTVFDAVLQPVLPAVRKSSEEEFREIQARAWDAACASIDRGVPVIAWMPITPEQVAQGIGCEYGLLVGYDREARCYQVRLPWAPMFTVAWDGFGRRDPVNWFNVIVFGQARTIAYRTLEAKVLQRAIAHAHSATPGWGLQGYDTWIAALEQRDIDNAGSIRQARILQETRRQAAAFLHELAAHYPRAAADMSAAAEKYATIAAHWEQYPAVLQSSAETNAVDVDVFPQAIALVTKIRDHESEAIAGLEKVLAVISG